MNSCENDILNIYYNTYKIPIGIFDSDTNLCRIYADFGQRLTFLYLEQATNILSITQPNDFSGFGLDKNGSCWCDIPLKDGMKLLYGPVQIGMDNNYPYADIPEYSEDIFYKISLSLCRQLIGNEATITGRSGDYNKEKSTLAEADTAYFSYVDPQNEIYACIRNGDTEELKKYMHKGKMYSYITEKLIDSETAKTVYIFNLSRCYHIAVDEGLPVATMNSMMTVYMNDIKKITTPAAYRSAILRVMYDFAKIINRHKKDNVSLCVRKALSYISQHIYERIVIQNIADYCSVSLSSLQHKFKEEIGHSISDEIQKQKIRKACFFLQYTSLSGTDIALKLGYCTQSYFNKHFKKLMGISPLQYKQQCKE